MTESSEYMNCPSCGRPVKADATVCGHCWTKFQGEVVKSTSRLSRPSAPNVSSEIARLTVRYRDTYAVASTMVGFGAIVKAIGLILGALVFIASVGTAGGLGARVIIGGLILG